MDPRKQATLLNYHKAIQDSVDIYKIWPDMESLFTEKEKRSIQSQQGKEEMRKFIEVLITKEDKAFDTLIHVLRRNYRWLSTRLRQGLKDEERRVLQAEKGIRQKITLALLTARISERQKEEITMRVSHVMKQELNDRALRVSIPDHEAAAELESANKRLKKIINEELDPMLYGRIHETDLSNSEIDEAIKKLHTMLVEMNVIQDIYDKMGLHTVHGGSRHMPYLLRQKIEETLTKIILLEKEKKELAKEKAELSREKNEQHQELTSLETENRSLELQNQNLSSDREKLEEAVRKTSILRDSLEIERRKLEDQNVWMESMLDNLEGENQNYVLKNKRLLEINQKLTRDIQKIAGENEQLRREIQAYYSNDGRIKLQHDNKMLAEANTKLNAELGRVDSEKRQLMIKNQKMEYENESLKEQKRRLLIEKRKYWQENQFLKTEAKRLAVGRCQADKLPAIKDLSRSRMSVRFSDSYDNMEDGKKSARSRRSSRSNKSATPGGRMSSRRRSPSPVDRKTNATPTSVRNGSDQKRTKSLDSTRTNSFHNAANGQRSREESKQDVDERNESKRRASVYDYRRAVEHHNKYSVRKTYLA